MTQRNLSFVVRLMIGTAAFLSLGVAPFSHAETTAQPQGQQPPQPLPQERQTLPLRIVNKAEFCGRLTQVFQNFGAANGFDRVQTAMLANGATAQVVQEFRTGRATDYLNAAALASYSRQPNRAPVDGYLPLAGFVGPALGLSNNVTIALSSGELRFIPFAQRGMDIVVIAQNAAALTPERAKKVAEVASQAQIKIHIVWVGPEAENGAVIEEARSLAWLAAVTGGAFANLSGKDNPCALSL